MTMTVSASLEPGPFHEAPYDLKDTAGLWNANPARKFGSCII